MQSLPKIVFLDHVAELGGAELCLIDLVRHNARRSQVILMADGPLRGALEQVCSNVSVRTLPRNVSRFRRSGGLRQAMRAVPQVMMLAFKISRAARSCDLIWANSQKSFVIGCLVSILSRRPLVWHLHDMLTADHFSRVNRRIAIGLANRFAAKVVTVSQSGMQSFVDSGGRADRCCVVYNGISAVHFTGEANQARSGQTRPGQTHLRQAQSDQIHSGQTQPAHTQPGQSQPVQTQPRQSLREEFSIGDAPLIGVFGRLTPWKGQDILIQALPALPGMHAVIVGEAIFGEDEYAGSLRKLAGDRGVADRTHFAGFRNDVAAAMGDVDLVVHTSTSPEPFGRVLVEAMLARRPLIASAAGGAAEIVTHKVDGILVRPGIPDILAAAIREVVNYPVQTQAMVDQAYKTAISRFSLDSYLAGTDEVARSVLQARKPASFSGVEHAANQ